MVANRYIHGEQCPSRANAMGDKHKETSLTTKARSEHNGTANKYEAQQLCWRDNEKERKQQKQQRDKREK